MQNDRQIPQRLPKRSSLQILRADTQIAVVYIRCSRHFGLDWFCCWEVVAVTDQNEQLTIAFLESKKSGSGETKRDFAQRTGGIVGAEQNIEKGSR